MSNLENEFGAESFVFETVMRVRHTEIGIGQHLTIDAMVALLAEVRARFLFSKGIKEINAEYQGFVITDVATHFISRAKAREELLFEVGVQNLTERGGDFIFKVTRMYDGSDVARAVMGFVAYDYRLNQEIPLTGALRNAVEAKEFEL
ncbi:thioesterase-like protein [Moraxella macacae 0408225]|uniref:Thioesterase-like protein n=1 Tax=Moraxella macacae 0408225 TaxID=1230338 RepID=L2F7R0_9GAMM|nr:thioesterase family protein [Moraxella macacae]ELA08955.1 thioesterase-like protein [Moraxella macacae 0408225]